MTVLENENDLRIALYLIKSKMPVIVRHTVIPGSTNKGKTLQIKQDMPQWHVEDNPHFRATKCEMCVLDLVKYGSVIVGQP